MKSKISFLHECFKYQELDGALIWKIRPVDHFEGNENSCARWNGKLANKVAGKKRPDGRVVVGLTIDKKKKFIYASHIVWAMTAGKWPTKLIDHKNRVRSDDRICNLREATSSQNSANKTVKRTRLLPGVKAERSRFVARVKVGGYYMYRESFKTEQEAHLAYIKARDLLHGDFAPR